MRRMPTPRGPLSELLLEHLVEKPHDVPPVYVPGGIDPLRDDDLHLALYLIYELHYRGLPGVDERWEWEPSLLRLRRTLERGFERALLEVVPADHQRQAAGRLREPCAVDQELQAIAAQDGPPLSGFIRTAATLEQVREFLVHRSAYQLKEADPHSWALPRLTAKPKAALIEIQADEYGAGRAEWIHAELFARSMAACRLNPSYGAYLELIPGVTLATVNLMSLFGLHRRLRGAVVGHLALFEMTSSIPNRRYADGLRRLGLPQEATLFFDEHVEADAVHEHVAAVDLAGGLAAQEPQLRDSILWGARALVELDRRWAAHVLKRWRGHKSSLLAPLGSVCAPAGSGEPQELVRTVTKWSDLGSSTTTEGSGIPFVRDGHAPGAHELEGSPDDQRPVAVGRDQNGILGRHHHG